MSNADKYRAIEMGHRLVAGVLHPSATRIEKFDTTVGCWVYLTAVHPSDASSLVKKLNQ